MTISYKSKFFALFLLCFLQKNLVAMDKTAFPRKEINSFFRQIRVKKFRTDIWLDHFIQTSHERFNTYKHLIEENLIEDKKCYLRFLKKRFYFEPDDLSFDGLCALVDEFSAIADFLFSKGVYSFEEDDFGGAGYHDNGEQDSDNSDEDNYFYARSVADDRYENQGPTFEDYIEEMDRALSLFRGRDQKRIWTLRNVSKNPSACFLPKNRVAGILKDEYAFEYMLHCQDAAFREKLEIMKKKREQFLADYKKNSSLVLNSIEKDNVQDSTSNVTENENDQALALNSIEKENAHAQVLSSNLTKKKKQSICFAKKVQTRRIRYNRHGEPVGFVDSLEPLKLEFSKKGESSCCTEESPF